MATTVLLILVGLGDDTILVVFRSTGIRLGQQDRWLVLLYSVPVTLAVTMGASNATNLIDGLDGLCSGVLGIIAAGFLVLTTSTFKVNEEMGLLTAMTIIIALIVDFFLLPALLMLGHRKEQGARDEHKDLAYVTD